MNRLTFAGACFGIHAIVVALSDGVATVSELATLAFLLVAFGLMRAGTWGESE